MSIFVTAHKEAEFPKVKGYIPIFVGKDSEKLVKKYGGVLDSSGDNIAVLNPYYSELTAQYWIWKNSTDEIKGIVHYRRYFRDGKQLISLKKCSFILENYDVIAGKPHKVRHSETVFENYVRYHYKADLLAVIDEISTSFPAMLPALEEILKSKEHTAMNMFISKHELFDAYSEWLFDVLMNSKISLDEIKKRSKFQQRAYGFLSERLFDVWVKYNQCSVYRIDVLETLSPNKNHLLISRVFERFLMRGQKALQKLKRILKEEK